MHAASRHGTPSVTSLPKDGGVSCFWSFIWKVADQVSDRTQPCLTSVKLMELAGPLGHSPQGLDLNDDLISMMSLQSIDLKTLTLWRTLI